MGNEKVDFNQVAEIDMEHYFGKGKKSLLKREEDVNMLLLQLATIVNEISRTYNVVIESSIGDHIKKLHEIREKE